MKITPKAADRCEKLTLAEQLEQYRTIHAVELAIAKKRSSLEHDQADIITGFEADASWSGQHARLTKGSE